MERYGRTKLALFVALIVLTLSVVLAVISLFPTYTGNTQTRVLVNSTFTLSPNEIYRQGLGSFRGGENISVLIQSPTIFVRNFSILTYNGSHYTVSSSSDIAYTFKAGADYYDAVFTSVSSTAGEIHFQTSVQQPQATFSYSWLNEPAKTLFILSSTVVIVVLMTATTDAKGEVHFKLPTREFSETQVLPLKVALPERNLQTAVNFMLSAQAFSIRRRAPCGRSTWPARPSRRRSTRTTPRASRSAKSSRSRSSSRPRSTARWASGSSRSTRSRRPPPTARRGRRSRLDKGGNYVVRVEGIDRFKNADHRAVRRADLRRRGQGAAPHPGRHAHLQGRRHGRDQGPLARAAGAGPGHVPGRPRVGLPAGRVEAGRQRAFDPDDRAAGAELRSLGGRDDGRRESAEGRGSGECRVARALSVQ